MLLCDIHKTNQIESNSQLKALMCGAICCCVISTKLIKLKAIHNALFGYSMGMDAV